MICGSLKGKAVSSREVKGETLASLKSVRKTITAFSMGKVSAQAFREKHGAVYWFYLLGKTVEKRREMHSSGI